MKKNSIRKIENNMTKDIKFLKKEVKDKIYIYILVFIVFPYFKTILNNF